MQKDGSDKPLGNITGIFYQNWKNKAINVILSKIIRSGQWHTIKLTRSNINLHEISKDQHLKDEFQKRSHTDKQTKPDKHYLNCFSCS